MGSPEQQSSLPGRQTVRGLLTRTREFVAGAPLPVRILLIALLCICAVPLVPIAMFAALIYAPYALWSGERSAISTASVALWGIAVTAALAHGSDGPRYLLLLLCVAVAVLSHAGLLGRWPVPCRTTAWALVWSLPVGIAMFRIWQSQPYFGPAAAAMIALVVLGWRLAKALQDSREHARRTSAGALAAPFAAASAKPAPSGHNGQNAQSSHGRRNGRAAAPGEFVTGTARAAQPAAASAARIRAGRSADSSPRPTSRRSLSRRQWPSSMRWSA